MGDLHQALGQQAAHVLEQVPGRDRVDEIVAPGQVPAQVGEIQGGDHRPLAPGAPERFRLGCEGLPKVVHGILPGRPPRIS